LIANRKSYIAFQTTQKSLTLDGFEESLLIRPTHFAMPIVRYCGWTV